MAIMTLLDAIIVIICGYFTIRALFGKSLLDAIVYFMFFGVFVSFIWVRLNAPDVALAEIAIGTALTGALFLSASGPQLRKETQALTRYKTIAKIFPVISAILVANLLVFQKIKLPRLLPEQFLEQLPQSGVDNVVTAILLNFRAYDTLIEIIVLFAAAIGVWAMNQSLAPNDRRSIPIPKESMTPVIILLRLILIPIMIIFAGYVLWVGYKAPGGAFQAGAILSGLVIIWDWINPQGAMIRFGKIKGLLIVGPLVFAGVGVGLDISHTFMTFSPKTAKYYILVIEIASTLSIAAALSLIYLGLVSHFGEEE